MAPVIALLAFVRAMALAPVLTVTVPPAVRAPVWLTGPVAVRIRLPPTVEAASWVAPTFFREASPVPLVASVIGPTSALLALVSVIAALPAVVVKLEAPVALSGFVWVIAPPDV